MRSGSATPLPPETFELERIRLRRPRLSDADAIFEYGSDPDVARYADWPARTSVDSVIESLRQRTGPWSGGTGFHWVITLRDDDRAIGSASCSVDGDGAEFGFVLNRKHWRKGYATEVSRALVGWIFSVPSVRRLSATCDAENLASARVLEKSGLAREAILERSIVRPNLSPEPRDAFLYSRVRE